MLNVFVVAALAAMPVVPRETPLKVGADRVVRVGDVVAAPLPAALARRIVLRVPEHKRSITVTHVAMAALVRHVAPDLRIAEGKGDIAIVVPDRPHVDASIPDTPDRPAIARGETVRLVSTSGPVRIERAVTALQDAGGPRIFVRDEDGQVFAVRIGATRMAEDVR